MADREQQIDQEFDGGRTAWARGKRRRRRVELGATAETGCGDAGLENGAAGRG